MQTLSYENECYLHVTENSFSYEKSCTKTRFEKEVQDNSEMAYWHIHHFRSFTETYCAVRKHFCAVPKVEFISISVVALEETFNR